jgi:hypothetical protein
MLGNILGNFILNVETSRSVANDAYGCGMLALSLDSTEEMRTCEHKHMFL